MELLSRRILWRKPIAIERLPAIARLYRAAYTPSSRLRYELARIPLRPLFRWFYSLGWGGEAALRMQVKGRPRTFPVDCRNLQFSSLYLPQHLQGYEPETTALLDILVTPRGVFFDVGSNWGYYALAIAARPDFSGKVHAFEPNPGSFEDLRALVAAAGLSAQVVCHNLGLSDRTGPASLRLPEDMHGGRAAVAGSGPASVAVALERLDAMGIDRPDVIKMDIEGHEDPALAGAVRTLSASKPHVVFESLAEPRAPQATLAPFRRLESLGYAFFYPAWLRTLEGGPYCLESEELREGEPAWLALAGFDPRQRFLFRDQLNVLACHRDRLAELRTLFDPMGGS